VIGAVGGRHWGRKKGGGTLGRKVVHGTKSQNKEEGKEGRGIHDGDTDRNLRKKKARDRSGKESGVYVHRNISGAVSRP